MLGDATTCPCLGERSNRWHDSRRLPRCEASKAAHKLRNSNRKLGLPPWKPGTDIEIPEIDPL